MTLRPRVGRLVAEMIEVDAVLNHAQGRHAGLFLEQIAVVRRRSDDAIELAQVAKLAAPRAASLRASRPSRAEQRA